MDDEPGVFNGSGQLSGDGPQGHDVDFVEIVRRFLLDHQHPNLLLTAYDGYGQK
jgi:hypothetical protein